MAKKITLKDKDENVLCPHTAIEQVEGLRGALDGKLGKSEKAVSATEADSAYKLNVMSFRPASANVPITDGGLYQFKATSNMIEGDPGKDGHIIHSSWDNSEWSSQLFLGADVGMSVNDRMKVRWQEDGIWSDWKSVAFTDSTVASVIDGCISTSKIADTAITSAKIQTSIALNGTPSMTVEPTTSSPDKTIASVGLVKTVVNNLKIGTRNLLPSSKEITIDGSAITSGSKYITKKLPISVAVGDVLTFSCEDLIINAGTDETHAILLYSGGALATVKYISPTSKTATITVTKASTTPYLYMYAGYSDDSAGKSITYKGATLVKGDKPMLLWQRAEEDLDDVADYTVFPNLISASDLELGGLTDANGSNSTTTSATRARSAGYIPVSAPKITLKSWTDGVVFYLWTYDANKNPIQMSFSSTNWVSAKYTYTLPSGTAYIRLCIKKTSGAEFTLSELKTLRLKAENGSKATDWQPSAADMQVSRPVVYYQSTQPSAMTANEGDIWIIP